MQKTNRIKTNNQEQLQRRQNESDAGKESEATS